MSTASRPAAAAHVQLSSKSEERRVIFASSLGTVFEWYDFYLYATLAPFFAALFFPKGNDTAALLSAFATYAAGFLVRPFGALVFGRIGDLVGRKYTFLVTIVIMGFSTFAVGLLPTYESIGWAAPVLLVSLRLLQGLALGGEYGGAATYVAEHAAQNRRGYDTSWIQTTATLGFFLALLVIGICRFSGVMEPKDFATWGWRIPFLVSLILLIFSIYIRLKLNESPVFQRMKAEGKGSKSPLRDSFLKYPNNKYVLLALLGATAGQGVVWYTGQFYALFFLIITLKLDGADDVHTDRAVAADRHAVLHRLRCPVGQDRTAEDHLGGLPDRCGDILPAVQGADALRESRARNLPDLDIDKCCCERLPFSHLCRALVEIQRLRQDSGFSDEGRIDVHDDSAARGFAGYGYHEDRHRRAKGLRRQEIRRGAEGRRLSARRSRQIEDQLPDDDADPGHHDDLRNNGIRTDRGVPGRTVPHSDSLYVDVAAVSHRQRLVRRHAAVARDGDSWHGAATSTSASGIRSSSR